MSSLRRPPPAKRQKIAGGSCVRAVFMGELVPKAKTPEEIEAEAKRKAAAGIPPKAPSQNAPPVKWQVLITGDVDVPIKKTKKNNNMALVEKEYKWKAFESHFVSIFMKGKTVAPTRGCLLNLQRPEIDQQWGTPPKDKNFGSLYMEPLNFDWLCSLVVGAPPYKPVPPSEPVVDPVVTKDPAAKTFIYETPMIENAEVLTEEELLRHDLNNADWKDLEISRKYYRNPAFLVQNKFMTTEEVQAIADEYSTRLKDKVFVVRLTTQDDPEWNDPPQEIHRRYAVF